MSTIEMVGIALIGTISSARVTRLIVFDTWPVMEWIRKQWYVLVGDSAWAKLMGCHYCASPYVTLFLFGWGYLTDWQLGWWLFNGWLAASYAASVFVAYDGEE